MRDGVRLVANVSLLWLLVGLSACRRTPDALTFSGSVLGAEGAIVRRQVERFAKLHPELPVEIRDVFASDGRRLDV